MNDKIFSKLESAASEKFSQDFSSSRLSRPLEKMLTHSAAPFSKKVSNWKSIYLPGEISLVEAAADQLACLFASLGFSDLDSIKNVQKTYEVVCGHLDKDRTTIFEIRNQYALYYESFFVNVMGMSQECAGDSPEVKEAVPGIIAHLFQDEEAAHKALQRSARQITLLRDDPDYVQGATIYAYDADDESLALVFGSAPPNDGATDVVALAPVGKQQENETVLPLLIASPIENISSTIILDDVSLAPTKSVASKLPKPAQVVSEPERPVTAIANINADGKSKGMFDYAKNTSGEVAKSFQCVHLDTSKPRSADSFVPSEPQAILLANFILWLDLSFGDKALRECIGKNPQWHAAFTKRFGLFRLRNDLHRMGVTGLPTMAPSFPEDFTTQFNDIASRRKLVAWAKSYKSFRTQEAQRLALASGYAPGFNLIYRPNRDTLSVAKL
jgi:hypothetical protein